MEKYLHPSVESNIRDLSETFVTAIGNTSSLVVTTSDQGEDNVIKEVNSASEYIAKYGEPNFNKHGQASYNAINILNSGGKVNVLRVMPEDAGYSNLMVNVQVKSENRIKYLRPVVGYAKTNSSIKSLEASLKDSKFNGTVTVDGYVNSLLMAILPNGRGKAYDSLAVKFELEDGYDDTYDFRVYQFSVFSKNNNGELSLIEGPFTVALAPEAKTQSGDSLFIKTVVERYSNVLKVLFNEEAYDNIGALLNAEVNPMKLDMLFGIQKLVNDKPETYFDTKLQKELPTHNGIVLDDMDSITKEAISLENKKIVKQEKDIEKDKEDAVAVMKSVRGNAYINDFKTKYQPNLSELGTAINSALALQTEALTAYGALSEEQLLADRAEIVQLINDSDSVKAKIDTAYDKLGLMNNGILPVYDYPIGSDLDKAKRYEIARNTKMFTISSNILKLEELKGIVDGCKGKVLTDTYVIKSVKDDMTKVVNTLETMNVGLEKHTEGTAFIDTLVASIKAELTKIENALLVLEDKYSTPEELTVALGAIKTAATVVITKLSGAIAITKINLYADYNKTLGTVEGTLLETFLKTNLSTALDGLFKETDDKGTLVTAMESPEERKALAEKALAYVDHLEETVANQKLVQITIGEAVIGEANFLKEGSNGNIDYDTVPVGERLANINALLVSAFKGNIDGSILDEKQIYLDFILDAGYPVAVKNAIVELGTNIRKDFVVMLDMGVNVLNPDDALRIRSDALNYNDFRVAIFTQSFVVEDAQFTKNDIQVSPTFFLASKVPSLDDSFGMQYTLSGVRRGAISGFKTLSWKPNPMQKEKLYKKQINYIEVDNKATKFATQKTSQLVTSALSNINNVRVLLKIQKDVNELMQDFLQEFNDATTLKAANNKLTNYLKKWTSNRACTSIKGTVYASDYDKKQGTLRVKIELVFNKIVERIVVDLVVKG